MDRQRKNTELFGERLFGEGRRLMDRISTEQVKAAFHAVLSLGVSFFFGKTAMMFDTYPLGIAYFAASGSHLIASFCGLALAALMEGETAALHLTGYLIAAAARYAAAFLTDRKHFSANRLRDTLLHKLVAALSGVFTVSMVRIVSGGFVYYDLFAAVFLMGLAALFTFLYAQLLSGQAVRRRGSMEAGACALIFSFVLALRGTEILGFSLALVFAFLATFYASSRGGAMRGGVTGFLSGLAVSVTVSPSFALIGFTAGAIFPSSKRLGCILSSLAGFLCLYYTVGLTELFSFVPEAALSVTLSLFLIHLQKRYGDRLLFGASADAAAAFASAGAVSPVPADLLAREAQAKDSDGRIGDISEFMQSMSEVFFALSQKQRTPSLGEARAICEKTFGRYCRTCSLCHVCRKTEALSTADAIEKTAEIIVKEGRLTPEGVPKYLRERCSYADRIVREIGEALVSFVSERIRSDKVEVVAFDYAQISRLLQSAAEDGEGDYKIDEKSTETLVKSTVSAEFCAGGLLVLGERKKRILAGGVNLGHLHQSAGEIRRSFEAVLGIRLTEPDFKIEHGDVTMALVQSPRIRCVTGKSTAAKDGEAQNGDTAVDFAVGDDTACALICDGMGSGREAAVTSRLCGVFLEKILALRGRRADAVSMLNHFIRQKGTECFSTLDLLTVDLLNAKASFLKCGACPSYVVREGRIFKIFSKTPPVGIMKAYSGEEIAFDLAPGDVIVMMSDGVFDAEESEIWLYNLLTYEMEESPSALSEKILDRAEMLAGKDDDRTVTVMRIFGMDS